MRGTEAGRLVTDLADAAGPPVYLFVGKHTGFGANDVIETAIEADRT